MNVYDEAHNLARAIKESNEFIEFNKLRQEVEKDEQFMEMLKEVKSKQFEIQAAQMQGKDVDADTMSQINSLISMIGTKPNAAAYFEAEARFSMMLKDVFDVLGDVVEFQI
ncbi:MAG: YlbF family regulator [Clostridiales bacterium]|jgi:cell fate (sporulation/competence/biofilm development) regulator YlbF (YheA/YmcA/DUF963 family)|nr:YlbF family regulator [Clostridiales bacterium]